MTTQTKQIVQVKITFEGEDLQNWEKLKQMWQGASATSILRMAVNKVAKDEEEEIEKEWGKIGLRQIAKWAKEDGDDQTDWDLSKLKPIPKQQK